ncbi:hypothetical protein NEPTK9_001111 [Candidatus Neptunochlamydia vexilliferae]|uniref:Uncharacterized protein n=2 Tax=Candidatus Neptunichlamydia vexilliferae TaxID=1651774 RepID=A0ABS0B064_9BACT|nr:hypothetical protein [Candidatus Neptunochlamydia vexilliferae]
MAFSSMQEEYTELFGEKFSQMDIEGCHEILDEWSRNSYEDYGIIEGFRATLCLGSALEIYC